MLPVLIPCLGLACGRIESLLSRLSGDAGLQRVSCFLGLGSFLLACWILVYWTSSFLLACLILVYWTSLNGKKERGDEMTRQLYY